MSIQQQQHKPVRYGSSSSVMSVSNNFDSSSSTIRMEQNRRGGNDEYDPFAIDDDDDNSTSIKIENEQSVNTNGDIETIESNSTNTTLELSKQTHSRSVIVSSSCLPSLTSADVIEEQTNQQIPNNPSVLRLCLDLKLSTDENVENVSTLLDEQTSKSTNDNGPFSNKNHDEQQERRRHSKSPHHHRSKQQSDHRSRSPRSHHSLSSSNRKRHRAASPDRPVRTVNAGESAPVTKQHKKSHRHHRSSSRKKSKTNRKHRSSSLSSISPSSDDRKTSESTIDATKTSITSEKTIDESVRPSSKRNEPRHSSRTYHHSKNSSRDPPPPPPSNHLIPPPPVSHGSQPFVDRRLHSNCSSPPLSMIHPHLPLEIGETNGRNHLETSTEDRNRIYNRLKNMNERHPTIDTVNHNSNTPPPPPLPPFVPSPTPSFSTSNGGSQRPRSNLIQIVTTEATIAPITPPQVSTQVQPDPLPASSEVKIDPPISINTQTNNEPLKTTPKKNGGSGSTDDMLMEEEMLLEEEEEQRKVKSIDLDSLTIPETSTNKADTKEVVIKTSIATKTTTLTPSPTKKPYTLYKVPNTNHTTPHLSLRNKNQSKKELLTLKSDSTTTTSTKLQSDESSSRTSLDERISTLLGAPANKTIIGNTPEVQLDNRPPAPANLPTRTSASTPSDKSAESPQDIPSLISTMLKKGDDRSPLLKKIALNSDERRSITAKHYTSEWLASQKPEEAPTEELTALPVPPLVTLPTLVSIQPSTTTSPQATVTNPIQSAAMIGKLSQAMSKFITKKQADNVPTTNETDDTVPMSAKHLERIERRRQREKRQSEIAAIAKEILKPAFRRHVVNKEEYKQIMKKVVTKATQANDVNRIRIGKMIDAYIAKYQASRTTSSSTINGHTR